MAPIRVALVGLSTSSSPMGISGWTMAAHLPSLISSPHYEIVALQNSTVESAQASIDFHQLGSHVKAYGTPEDIANDPNVDLVVVSVNLKKHYMIAKPAVLAGKDVFVEWPLGATTAEAEELTTLAKQHGVKTVVGLQGRADPIVRSLKSIIESGKIGKVLSTTVHSSFQNTTFPMWPSSVKQFFDRDSGLSILDIVFGHSRADFAAFLAVLGPFEKFSSVMETMYPTTNLVNSAGEIEVPNYQKTAADHMFIQGKLASGAVASIVFRASEKTADEVGTRWIISGTEGEIEITTGETVWHQMDGGFTIKLRQGKSDIEEIDYNDHDEPAYVEKVTGRAKNTARVYEAFATGNSEGYTTFEHATEEQHILKSFTQQAM